MVPHLSPADTALMAYVLAGQPEQVIIVGELLQELSWPANSGEYAPRVLRFDSLACCSGHEACRNEVALVSLNGVQSASSGNDALERALGQSVRLFPERLVACVDTQEPADTAFYAFGFRRLAIPGAGSRRLFEYSLSDYKQPPDWLNARFWANPERFELGEEPDIYCEENGLDEEE
jgi:hypothetical protein